MPRRKARGFRFASVFIAACVACAACDSERRERDARRASAQNFFMHNCAQCHGERGEGKQLSDRYAPPLRRGRVVAYSDEKIIGQVTYGGGGMPPFRFQLRPDQIRDIVRYVRELQKEEKQ